MKICRLMIFDDEEHILRKNRERKKFWGHETQFKQLSFVSP